MKPKNYGRSYRCSNEAILDLIENHPIIGGNKTFVISRKSTNHEASLRWTDTGTVALACEGCNASNKKLLSIVKEFLEGKKKLNPRPGAHGLGLKLDPSHGILKRVEQLSQKLVHTASVYNKGINSPDEKEQKKAVVTEFKYIEELLREINEWLFPLGKEIEVEEKPFSKGRVLDVRLDGKNLVTLVLKEGLNG